MAWARVGAVGPGSVIRRLRPSFPAFFHQLACGQRQFSFRRSSDPAAPCTGTRVRTCACRMFPRPAAVTTLLAALIVSDAPPIGRDTGERTTVSRIADTNS
jgi:hypothetical protein